MIFAGDVALPFTGAIDYNNIPERLKKEKWIVNLEGSLVKDDYIADNNLLRYHKVFNSFEAIKELQSNINIQIYNIANNHLLDAADVGMTLDNINDLGKISVGAGNNLVEASKAIVLKDGDTNYSILSFGWDCINCIYAKSDMQGVNPYRKAHVINRVRQELENGYQVICFFHWDYELEKYPQPYDRRFAMDLIDLGVCAVIGCHAHRVQQIELYKGKPIVYGLGNFLFRSGAYCKGALKFPSFTRREWAFEIVSGHYFLHTFDYNSATNELCYLQSLEVAQSFENEQKPLYQGMTDEQYYTFFKKNRVQKKGLPIFSANEQEWIYNIKSKSIKLRGRMIQLLLRLKIKTTDNSKR